MIVRNLLSAFTLSLVSFIVIPTPIARAEDNQQEIENSKFQAIGSVNGNAVYIRSGASDNDYPTIKLDRGTQVTVVGIKNDWLKIIPPEGSYCYVAKAYVDRRGDGTVGRVTNPLNVRVGSSLNAMKTKVAAKLENGDDVKIMGEQDEYFKIAPPKTVFLYVNKQFVDLVKTVDTTKTNTPPAPQDTPKSDSPTQAPVVQAPQEAPAPQPPVAQNDAPTQPPTPVNTPPGDASLTPPPSEKTAEVSKGPATQPTDWNQVASGSTTKPADAQAEAEAQFDQLERTFIENDKKTIDQQPIAELQAGYEKLAKSTALPESLRRMAEYRLVTVKQRADDQQRYLAVKKSQEEMRARQVALQAEREELESRIKNSGLKYFTAVGTLRVSSLQQGGGTLYRLTDPKTGRTVIYVRAEDPKIGACVGQFIGVQGPLATEQSINLKVVNPTSFEQVDQSKVNISVGAEIVPPSLMPSGIAGTGNE